jgi:hypothetical protein
MKNITRIAIVTMACSFGTAALAAQPTDFSSAKRNSVYATKKAECKREAKAKNFGVHFMKRNAWVKECIAGGKA